MSKEQLVDRMLADACGVDAWNIRTGNLSDEDFSKLSEAMGEMAEAPIYIDDTPGLQRTRNAHQSSPRRPRSAAWAYHRRLPAAHASCRS